MKKGVCKTRALECLKKMGNFRHNEDVIRQGHGVLAVCTPLKDDASPDFQQEMPGVVFEVGARSPPQERQVWGGK